MSNRKRFEASNAYTIVETEMDITKILSSEILATPTQIVSHKPIHFQHYMASQSPGHLHTSHEIWRGKQEKVE